MIHLTPQGFASSVFDYARFIAAFAVLTGHAVLRLFGPYEAESAEGIGELLFRATLSGYGSQGVTAFFVLSGFFIGTSVISSVSKHKFNFSRYFLKRLTRLWIVLIPALIITAGLDNLGTYLFPGDHWYGLIEKPILQDGYLTEQSNSTTSFFGNLFFLQTIIVPYFGSNDALWSLAYEFWYYIMFPLCLLGLYKATSVKQRFIYLSAFLLIAWFVGFDIVLSFLIWLLGIGAISRTLTHKLTSPYLFWTSVLLLMVVCVTVRLSPPMDSKFIERSFVAVAFFIFMLCTIGNDRPVSPSFHKVGKRLADFSYSLYLIHIPLICFWRGILITDGDFLAFNFSGLLKFVLVIGSTLLIALLFAMLTEDNTNRLYKKLKI